MKKKNNSNVEQKSSLARLDAILILLGELLKQLSKDKASMQSAREKSATVLVTGGLTQERAAKLLGMKKEKVVKAAKNKI